MRDRELIERLRSSAKAFRKHPIYTSDGDPVLLTVQADECDEAADRLEAQAAEIERLDGALRIAFWNEAIGRGLSQDAAISEVEARIKALKQGQNNE